MRASGVAFSSLLQLLPASAGPVYLLTARTKFGVSGGGLPSGCHVTQPRARPH